ncbi:MAG TPA: fibronectin type III domain-containing protein [Candidatus Dormibacteraeota bacterium]|nr:fibronectin type III domain-containing protein [Candidatus Dormibacteraeota bacterium]
MTRNRRSVLACARAAVATLLIASSVGLVSPRLAQATVSAPGTISTAVGSGQHATCGGGNGGAATAASLCYPAGLAFDPSGDLLIADAGNSTVRKVTPAGVISAFAGTSNTPGLGGDGGAATSALLQAPNDVAIDAAGDVFIADSGNDRIRKVSAAGTITTFAGTVSGYSGDGGLATAAKLNHPGGVAVDGSGDVFIGDTQNGAIRKVTPDGKIATIATIANPGRLAADGIGNLYVADGGPYGGGLDVVSPVGAVAHLVTGPVTDVAIAGGGQVVYTLSNFSWNSEVMAYSAARQTVIAGTNIAGYTGDGGPSVSAEVNDPEGLAFDSSANLFIADSTNSVVRRVQQFTAPDVPGSVTATAGHNSVRVSWTPPANTGGLPINAYEVREFLNGSSTGTQTVSGSPVPTSAVFSLLTAGASYRYDVTALNGWQPSSASSLTAPAVPTVLAPRRTLETIAGSAMTGPARTVAQYPYALNAIPGHLRVGDLANPVLWDVSLTPGNEAAFAGNDTYSYYGDGYPAAEGAVEGAGAVTTCGGVTYFADTFNFAIRDVDPAGNLHTLAGTGVPGYAGDGGPATSAEFGRVLGLACDGTNLYISDSDNGRVRVIYPDGQIATWFSGFSFPTGMVEVRPGVIDVSDGGLDNSVWQLSGTSIKRIAGTGTLGVGGDGGPATSASLADPRGLTIDSSGNLYIADTGSSRIRVVNSAGVINTIVGQGYPGFSGDGGLASAALLNEPTDVAIGRNTDGTPGNSVLYIADGSNFRIREVTLGGTPQISTIAGNGTPSLGGDGGEATRAELNVPSAVAFDASGNEYVADSFNEAIRRVAADGLITTAIGSGLVGANDITPSQPFTMNDPSGVAVGPDGDVYVIDSGNNSLLDYQPATGSVVAIIGYIYSGVGLAAPTGLAVDAKNDIFIADTGDNRIVEVPGDGTSHQAFVLAGTGTAGYSGDGSAAGAAQLNAPRGVALDGHGDLYVSDTGNNVIRKIDLTTNLVTTVAGNGKAGAAGDGHSATAAELNYPSGLAFDASGNLFIADSANSRIRMVDPGGTIQIAVAGCAALGGYGGDGLDALIGYLNFPYGVGFDSFGNLHIADSGNNRIRVVGAPLLGRGGPCPSAPAVAAPRGVQPSNSNAGSRQVSGSGAARQSRPSIPIAAGAKKAAPALVSQPVRPRVTAPKLQPATAATPRPTGGLPGAPSGSPGALPANPLGMSRVESAVYDVPAPAALSLGMLAVVVIVGRLVWRRRPWRR